MSIYSDALNKAHAVFEQRLFEEGLSFTQFEEEPDELWSKFKGRPSHMLQEICTQIASEYGEDAVIEDPTLRQRDDYAALMFLGEDYQGPEWEVVRENLAARLITDVYSRWTSPTTNLRRVYVEIEGDTATIQAVLSAQSHANLPPRRGH